MLTAADTQSQLKKKWQSQPDATSESRWLDLKNAIGLMDTALQVGRPQGVVCNMADEGKRKFNKALEDIILQYTYPRIDAEVSKHRNHLLKSPFCVHPGTGE